MAQITELSLLALPGMMHSFSPKAAAVSTIRAFGDAVLSITAKLSGDLSIEPKLQGTLDIEPKLDGTLSINE